jgi:Sec-independent protein translocase protein TatA
MIGTLECILFFLLAFILIGPKDFPKLMFKVGDSWRRMKQMGSTFIRQMEDMSEEIPPEKDPPS